jgi:4-hydroxy-tetrahydrodipicolinate reductase
MPRALVVGAMGRMGQAVCAAISESPQIELGAALEARGHSDIGGSIAGAIEISDDPKAALSRCNVAIDFTTPEASLQVMRAAAEAGVAYVCGTTGFSDAERAEIGDLAARIPIVHAPNFSISVNILAWLTREAAQKLGSGYDAELVEIHHSEKRDAPSGTSLHLAEAIAAGRGQKLADHLVLERAGQIGARPEHAIGIQTLRGGDIAGEHTVMFVGRGERLELAHRSSTRDHYARGAVRAAEWLAGRDPGLYPVNRVFGLESD